MMKAVVYLALATSAVAFNFGGKKAAPPAPVAPPAKPGFAFSFGAKKAAPVVAPKAVAKAAAKPAFAFNFGAKAAPTASKAAAPKKAAARAPAVSNSMKNEANTRDSLVPTPDRFKLAFGDYEGLQARQQARAEKIAAEQDLLVPTPDFLKFAFGNPQALRERREARLAKWEWSSSFLAKARPDKNNYGRGDDFFDDGLTKLERLQIAQGKEAYLTGGAKLRLKVQRGEI